MRSPNRTRLGSTTFVVCSSLFGSGWSLSHVVTGAMRPVEHLGLWIAMAIMFALVATTASSLALFRGRRLTPTSIWQARLPLVGMLVPLSCVDLITSFDGASHVDMDLALIGMVLIQALVGLISLKFGYACLRAGIEYLDGLRRSDRSYRRTLSTIDSRRVEEFPGRVASHYEWSRPPPASSLTL